MRGREGPRGFAQQSSFEPLKGARQGQQGIVKCCKCTRTLHCVADYVQRAEVNNVGRCRKCVHVCLKCT